jgi:tetratricopeptide (TPR) repeat protein
MGEVTDADGNPLQGVTVTVTTPELTDYEATYTSNKKGRFTAVFIDATKSYEFKLIKEGYQTYTETVKPTPGENIKVEFTLPKHGVVEQKSGEIPTSTFGLTKPQKIFNEGVAAAQEGDSETALAKFEEAAELDPDLYQAHLARAGIYLDQERWEDALAAAELVEQLDPGNIRAMEIAYDAHNALGHTEEVQELLAKMEKGGINVAARLFNSGVAALNVGDYKAAEAKFRRALESDPELAPAYSALAVVLLGLKDFQGSLDAAEQALQRDPGDDRAKRMRYQALRGLGRMDEAAAALDSMSPQDRHNALLDQYNLATEAFNAGQTEQAVEILEGIVAADPDYGKAHYMLGLSYTNLDEPDKAKQHLEKFLAVAPDDPDAATAQEMLKYLAGS